MAIILSGGRVIDPLNELDDQVDVLCENGRIAAIGANLAEAHPSAEVIDVRGHLVTPGLIDMHVHVFAGLGDFCVGADEVGVDMGVPVLVDGGTSGVATFDISRRAVIDHPSTRTRVLAFIDPNQLYLATKDFICHKLEIANDERNIDEASLAASLERNADVVIGLKVRTCWSTDPERSPFLEAAMRAAPNLPIMIHLGRFPHTPVISTPALLKALRPGDIITHAYRGAGGLMGMDGKPIPEFRDAIDRGVRLDIGHSGTDFRFREARRLLEHGYLPDTVSTDLNVFNINGPVFSLAETMSKMLALGIALRDVIAMATSNVARNIGKLDELGSLGVGRPAEISVLRLIDGPVPLSDGHETVIGDLGLAPVGCVRAGTWIESKPVGSFRHTGRTWSDEDPEHDW
jgi:dihydroorotase